MMFTMRYHQCHDWRPWLKLMVTWHVTWDHVISHQSLIHLRLLKFLQHIQKRNNSNVLNWMKSVTGIHERNALKDFLVIKRWSVNLILLAYEQGLLFMQFGTYCHFLESNCKNGRLFLNGLWNLLVSRIVLPDYSIIRMKPSSFSQTHDLNLNTCFAPSDTQTQPPVICIPHNFSSHHTSNPGWCQLNNCT